MVTTTGLLLFSASLLLPSNFCAKAVYFYTNPIFRNGNSLQCLIVGNLEAVKGFTGSLNEIDNKEFDYQTVRREEQHGFRITSEVAGVRRGTLYCGGSSRVCNKRRSLCHDRYRRWRFVPVPQFTPHC